MHIKYVWKVIGPYYPRVPLAFFCLSRRCIGQEKRCKKQLVGITTFEVAISVIGLAADLFSLCVQERSQTLTGQPGDHAHWVKRVRHMTLHCPTSPSGRMSVVVALW